MSEDSDDIDKIDEIARNSDIHPVCLTCKKKLTCKNRGRYSWWSWQMPPQEYCEDYELLGWWDDTW